MIFVKSILAGFLSLLLAAILLWVGFAVVLAVVTPAGGEAIAIDLVSVCRASYLPCLIVIVCMFAPGFSWEYRRLKRKKPPTNA
jgi:uncharacterized BrkB/YihY/UPF0761 family membrane protein